MKNETIIHRNRKQWFFFPGHIRHRAAVLAGMLGIFLLFSCLLKTASAQSNHLPFLLLLLGDSDYSLSTDKASPGEIITLLDGSIQEGDELQVTFSDVGSYTFVQQAFSVEDGRAKVVVPPYFNKVTDQYEAGNVTVSLSSQKNALLRISGLPELAGITPGSVVKVYLEKIVDNLTSSLPELDQLGVTYAYDMAGVKYQLQVLIDEITVLIDEIDTSGTFTTSSLILGISPLSKSDLKTVDRLLYAMMLGVYNEAQDSASLDVAGLQGQVSAKDIQIDLGQLAEGFASASQQSRDGIKATISQLKSVINTVGDLSSVPGWEPLLDVVEAVGRVVGVGALNEIVNILRSVDTGDISMPGQGFLDEFTAVLKEFIDGLIPNWAKKMPILIGKLQDFYKTTLKFYCKQEPLTPSFAATCLEWEVHPTVYPYINKAYFPLNHSQDTKTTILSGVSEQFIYDIGGIAGLKHAKITYVTIDWDDGNTSSFTHSSGYPDESPFGPHYTEHTYVLPASVPTMQYDIKITVVGDNDPAQAHKKEYVTTVVVTTDTAPLEVRFTSGDELLGVNEKGTWVVEVIGGAPPFEMTLQWDAWNIEAPVSIKKDRLIRTNTLIHSYPDAGRYTISFRVKDAKGDEVQADYEVVVGNGPESDYLIVDRVEYYAYYDQCGGVGACYDGEDIAWWYTKKWHYDIYPGTAKFSWDYQQQSVYEIGYTVNFTFDLPPRIIKKGEALPPLFMSGKGEGFTWGTHLNRQIGYYTKSSPTASNNYIDGALSISNREMPYDETTGYFTGDISKTSSSVITVPIYAGDGFCIGVRHGQDPGYYATWIYKPYTAQ